MKRREFLSTCLALAAAPAVVRADSLMRVIGRDTLVWKPESVSRGVIWTEDFNNGTVSVWTASVKYYPRRVSNDELRLITGVRGR